MNVLVIGGTLFIGRVLVKELAASGHSVTVLHRKPKHDLGRHVGSIQADRNDGAALRAALAGKQFDVVFDNVYDWDRGTIPGDGRRLMQFVHVADLVWCAMRVMRLGYLGLLLNDMDPQMRHINLIAIKIMVANVKTHGGASDKHDHSKPLVVCFAEDDDCWTNDHSSKGKPNGRPTLVARLNAQGEINDGNLYA